MGAIVVVDEPDQWHEYSLCRVMTIKDFFLRSNRLKDKHNWGTKMEDEDILGFYWEVTNDNSFWPASESSYQSMFLHEQKFKINYTLQTLKHSDLEYTVFFYKCCWWRRI